MLVYTAIIGPNGGRLIDPRVVGLHDYVCFTDRDDVTSDIWNIKRVVKPECMTDRVYSRTFKILLPKTDHAESLWIDSDLQLQCDPGLVTRVIGRGYDLIAMKHPWSRNIEDEAKAIAKRRLAPKDVLLEQVAKYRAEWPKENQEQVTYGGFLLRRHSGTVTMFNTLWWSEYSKWAVKHERDQMSVDYCLHHSKMRVRYVEGHYLNNRYVKWHAN